MGVEVTNRSRDAALSLNNEFLSILDKSIPKISQNMRVVGQVIGSLAKLPPIPRNIVPETLGTALKRESNWLKSASSYIPHKEAGAFENAWKEHTKTVNDLNKEPLFKTHAKDESGQSTILVPQDKADNLISDANTRSSKFQYFIPEQNR